MFDWALCFPLCLRSLPFSELGRLGITNQTHPKLSLPVNHGKTVIFFEKFESGYSLTCTSFMWNVRQSSVRTSIAFVQIL